MITNTTAKSTYTVTEGVTEYAIGFDYQYNPDSTPQIKVYVNRHMEDPLEYGVDYTISQDGLNVVVTTVVEVGDRLDIVRDIPMVQLSDYVIGRIDPEQIETDFDEAVMRDQQIKAEIDLISGIPLDHEARITAIEDKIPSTATDTNKLTDKDYVDTLVSNHTNRTDNPHSVTAAQVGLGNCDNTSDLNKPISTATQNALDLKANTADLGTAAAAATTDFATAAQGIKADSAVQPSDLATVATTGLYSDLSGAPAIPTVNDATLTITQGGVSKGTFTANASSDVTIDLDAGGGSAYEPDLFDFKWRDSTTSNPLWKLSDGNWIAKADGLNAYNHLVDDKNSAPFTTNQIWAVHYVDWYYRDEEKDATGDAYPYAYTNFLTNGTIQTIYTSTIINTLTQGPVYFYDASTSGATQVCSLYSSDFDKDYFRIPTRETIAGIEILYFQTTDGHKICLPNQATNIESLYTAAGVAWYYILDTTNERFKLPRSKHEHYGNRPVVGNGIALGITDGTNNYGGRVYGSSLRANLSSYGKSIPSNDTTGDYIPDEARYGITTDATKSGIISTPVQDTDQYKHLYFYIK